MAESNLGPFGPLQPLNLSHYYIPHYYYIAKVVLIYGQDA